VDLRRRRAGDQRQSKVRTAPLTVIGRLLLRMRGGSLVLMSCVTVSVRQAGAVGARMSSRTRLAGVRMIAAVRGEVRRRAELDRDQEEDEQHRRRVLAQVSKSDAAMLHAWLQQYCSGIHSGDWLKGFLGPTS
jgi:hypothetical protein